MKDQLKVLVLWLKEYSDYGGNYENEGVLETQLRQNKITTIQQIGDYLEEILAMDDDQIKDELKQQIWTEKSQKKTLQVI